MPLEHEPMWKPRILERFAEHNIAKFPPVVFVCPRCRNSMVYSRAPGVDECFKCSAQEPGEPYLRLDVVQSVLNRMAFNQRVEGELRTLIEHLHEVMGSGRPIHDVDSCVICRELTK